MKPELRLVLDRGGWTSGRYAKRGRRLTRYELDQIRKLFPAYLDRIGGLSIVKSKEDIA